MIWCWCRHAGYSFSKTFSTWLREVDFLIFVIDACSITSCMYIHVMVWSNVCLCIIIIGKFVFHNTHCSTLYVHMNYDVIEMFIMNIERSIRCRDSLFICMLEFSIPFWITAILKKVFQIMIPRSAYYTHLVTLHYSFDY